MGGCFHLRILQPFSELKKFGIDYAHSAFLPSSVGGNPEAALIAWVEQFDMIILQRCFKYEIFSRLKRACQIAGRKLVFETDDDYFFIPPTNPCHKEMHAPGVMDGFKKILAESDHITVTTQELKDIYLPYNKNITVLPNNVENVSLFKDEYAQMVGPDGNFVFDQTILRQWGFLQFPSYTVTPSENGKYLYNKMFRVQYSATPTHKEDYIAIRPHLEKFLEKFPQTVMTYIGDPWFVEAHPANHKNVIFVPNTPYDLYIQNLRGADLGIAPLIPDIFNMGKSSLKLLEYGSWGIPAVAPNFITYNRHFKHNETAMLYNNGKEFYEMMCEMATDHDKRRTLGLNAAKMIAAERTERVNAQERFNLYSSLIDGTPKHLRFLPAQGTQNA